MSTYNPKAAISCLPEGVYEASILDVIETTSKSSGNPMVKFTFEVYPTLGGSRKVFDYANFDNMLWRIKKIAKAISRVEEFESGVFDPRHYIGANLRLELTVEESAEFGDQNRIKKFEPSAAVSRPPTGRVATTGGVHHEEITEDDVPF